MLLEKAGRVIRLAREDATMTQAELADGAGVQQPTISAYESGAKTPRVDTLRKILAAARTRPSSPLMVYAEEIRNAATERGLSNVRVFGSAVRGRDTESSDIDLLVSVSDRSTIFDVAGFVNAVEQITGFDVDVLTDRQVHNPFFAHVLTEAVPL